MPDTPQILAFALVALGMVLTPGPNMLYLVSRSVSQGPGAGLVSLAGVGAGFVVYMLCAAFGVTALLMAIPFAYDALRFLGAAYLLSLAWRTLRRRGSPFLVRALPPDRAGTLFAMGLLTNLLNPKIALLYLSLMPQFIDPGRGDVLAQSLFLGGVQISISLVVNATIVVTAGSVATCLRRPAWDTAQRYLMGSVLAALAASTLSTGRAQ